MRAAFDHYFFGSYAAARPFLLLRAVLAMLALDTWLLMIGHAGRYGAGDFNVAHFRALDALAPMPTPGLYIGILLLAGLLALVVALTGPSRPIAATLFGLYTYSWSMSMLDSYQHHYFMSLLLFCVVFFPHMSASDVVQPDPEPSGVDARAGLVAGLGYPLLCATVALLYVFTALAKCDANWVDGATIQRISTDGEVLARLRAWGEALGIEGERFWALVATAVIPHELFIALGYALAPLRDTTGRPWLRHLCTLAAVAALLLHLGAEGMGLEIGWFSYYMLALAVVVLSPAALVVWLCRPLTAAAAWLADAFEDDATDADAAPPGPKTLGMALAIGVVLVVTGRMLVLPGAEAAGWVAAAALLGHALYTLSRGRPLQTRPLALAAGVGAAAMWVAISSSDVRWDYYRFRGGDLMRRGELEEALWTYETGERFAVERTCSSDRNCVRFGNRCQAGLCVDAEGRPQRDSRKHKIEQLRQMLGE